MGDDNKDYTPGIRLTQNQYTKLVKNTIMNFHPSKFNWKKYADEDDGTRWTSTMYISKGLPNVDIGMEMQIYLPKLVDPTNEHFWKNKSNKSNVIWILDYNLDDGQTSALTTCLEPDSKLTDACMILIEKLYSMPGGNRKSRKQRKQRKAKSKSKSKSKSKYKSKSKSHYK